MNQLLPYVFSLACPVAMAVMMWFMMRGTNACGTNPAASADPRIAALERAIQALRAERGDRIPERLKVG